MVFFGFLPREKDSVTNTFSAYSLRYSLIYFLAICLFKIYTNPEYAWVKNNYTIHTLSDTEITGDRNILIFTPERYLSFIDKNKGVGLDFVFVDEVYKLDNGFIIDEVPQ